MEWGREREDKALLGWEMRLQKGSPKPVCGTRRTMDTEPGQMCGDRSDVSQPLGRAGLIMRSFVVWEGALE